MTPSLIRIATRRSDLALWQAHYVADCLRELNNAPVVEIVHIVTSGDRDQSSALREFGGTGAFTREVQRAVLENRAEIAVHSLKDLPTQPTDGLVLAAVPKRAATHDVLVLSASAEPVKSLGDLPAGSRIGTGSPRRAAQLRHLRSDLVMEDIRGNVPTRLEKLDRGDFDAIILADAGLRRLKLSDRISLPLGPPEFYGAVGQGALGIECRDDDRVTHDIIGRLTCRDSLDDVTAERSLLATLRAGCHAPVGVQVQRCNARLQLTAVLLSHDGAIRIEQHDEDLPEQAADLGRRVAEQMIAAGGDKLLEASPSG